LVLTTTGCAAICRTVTAVLSIARFTGTIATTSGDGGIAALTIETGIRRAGIPIITIDGHVRALKI